MSDIIKTKGIVLNYLKYGDNHLVANIFTQTHGHISFFIRGSAKKKNKYKNLLLPLNVVHVEFLYHPQKDLQHFKSLEVEFANDFFMSPQKSAVAFLLSDFFSKIGLRQAPSSLFFSFILTAIKHLNTGESVAFLFLQTLASSLHLTGFAPEIPKDARYFNLQDGHFVPIAPNGRFLDKDETQYFIQLLSNDFLNPPIKVPATQRLSLIDKLLFFYDYHLNIGRLTSYDTLKEMYISKK